MAEYTVFRHAEGPKLPDDPVSRADIDHVKQFGYVVLENIFTLSEAAEAKAEIARLSGQTPLHGRNVFEGFDTNRIYSLLNKSRVFDKFTILPRVLALNDYFLDPGYQLTAFHTIQINPGETPQELHCDDGFCNLPRPRGPLGAAIIVAFDAFTEDNGATRLVPGSHLWGPERPTPDQARPMTCPAGSVVYFLGTTWHGGGPNTSGAPRYSATVQYCQPYIRPIENQFLAVDPRRLPEIDPRIVQMMGYRMHWPFIGYADGLGPVRAARRMVEWLQKPLLKNPPAFPDHGTGKANL